MALRSPCAGIRPQGASPNPAPTPSDAGRRERLADALAHLDRRGVDVVLDGPGDRFRYVVEGRAFSARGIVALALRLGLEA